MGRKYSVVFENVAVTAAQDFFEINAPSGKSVVLHSVYLSQHTELADAAEEQIRVAIITGHATSGSGGSAPTAQPLDTGDAAFGGTVEVNNTTIASTGTASTKHTDTMNVRAGWVYRPTPEERISIGGGVRLVVRLGAAPADSVSMNGTAIFEEIG